MSEIICPDCGCSKIKKNGHIHTGAQNYKCLSPECSRQFILNPTKKYISEEERELVKRLLLERISLSGICRVVGVSETWLFKFIKEVYKATPDDLNVVVNMEEIEKYSDEQFDKHIYNLMEKKT